MNDSPQGSFQVELGLVTSTRKDGRPTEFKSMVFLAVSQSCLVVGANILK